MSPRGGEAQRSANHLAGETSPYLLQHLYNPVDWYPWGEAALERARREDKPVFLSIGYAACHWCHVMERESFEDPRTAELLNRDFVPIKVDREERPDIDEIYMNAVQLMTGHGGWPLSVFLTPALEPFIGGTYFPPEDRQGLVGFRSLLGRVREAWAAQRIEIDRSATRMAEHLREIAAAHAAPTGGGAVGRADIARAAAELTSRFDPACGGFGPAPKFPAEGALALLLDEHARSGDAVPLEMAEATLTAMARGGIYDHVGGGFARYSVDERWLVPHFEKMLYNQALLVPVYADAWLLTRKPLYRRVVEQTLDFVRREMTSPAGGFYSSLDADSEGVEGRFYVWTPDQLLAALGDEDGRFFATLYDITDEGNFEGASIPNLLAATLAERAAALGLDEAALVARVERLRLTLLAARGQRVRPATDDKILSAWNGLMIGAAARTYRALGRPEDLESARRAAEFVLRHLAPDGRLRVSFREGRAKLGAYLDDHAFLARGLLELYEAGFDVAHLEQACRMAETLLARFEDAERGGFFFTAHDHESLIARNRSSHDGALPAGAGVAAEVLLRLAIHTGNEAFRHAGQRAIESSAAALRRGPSAFAATLTAVAFAERSPIEVAIVGEPRDPATLALLALVRGRYRPSLVVQLGAPGEEPGLRGLLAGKRPIDARPAAYVCRDRACSDPVTDPVALASRLGDFT